MNLLAHQAARFTGWSAVIGGCFAYLNVALVLAATGGDTGLLLHGPSMLGLPAEARELFRWGMFADVLGFYLPVLVIGGYLWHVFRDRAGALGDIALLAITLYTVVGVAGAALQLAALTPLANLHLGGDETVKAAAEAAWTAIAHGSQKGLWWAEGPVVLFWGLVVGHQLRQAGWRGPILWLLQLTGWGFALFFLLGMFPGLDAVMKLMLIVVVLIFPCWMLMFGWRLLRQPGALAVAA